MLTTLIYLLIAGLVLYLIYYFVAPLLPGKAGQILGIILALIFLIYALNSLGFLGGAPRPLRHSHLTTLQAVA